MAIKTFCLQDFKEFIREIQSYNKTIKYLDSKILPFKVFKTANQAFVVILLCLNPKLGI